MWDYYLTYRESGFRAGQIDVGVLPSGQARHGRVVVIGRRPLLLGAAGLLCAAAAPALPIPTGDRLGFRIFRKGSAIGTHDLDFVTNGDTLTVNVAIDIRVGIGPIVLFRYTHRSREYWRDGQFMTMETKTYDNGANDFVSLHRVDSGLAVKGSRVADYIAPPNALPGSHWNEKMLTVPAVNTQNGRLILARVTALGEEAVPDAAGGTIEARHFKVRGDANLDTWYDNTATWAALRFTSHEGSEIVYERM
jgi:hypothetical protein